MAMVFITGSSDGLGLMAGRLLVEQGHAVTLHARTQAKADATRAALSAAADIVVGDLSTIAAMRQVAEQANAGGRFDAVIHNVGLGYTEPRRVETADGFSQLWAVNVLAPYVLTALMAKPGRLVYLSSGMHTSGGFDAGDPQWAKRPWAGSQAYADTKFQDTLLAFAVARRWPSALSNAVTPGWVATRMGGAGASDDLDQGHCTQAWLAVGEDARASGDYFYHLKPARVSPAARDETLQDRLLAYCEEVSGIALPA